MKSWRAFCSVNKDTKILNYLSWEKKNSRTNIMFFFQLMLFFVFSVAVVMAAIGTTPEIRANRCSCLPGPFALRT